MSLGLATLEKPLELSSHRDRQPGRWGGLYPARVICPWAWQRSKSPWSLALIVTDNQSEGRWGRLDPARVMRFWAWQRTKKPLQLSSHRDRQPERGALGWNLLYQGDVSLGLATLEKPLQLSSHRDRQPERGALGVESTLPGWCVPLPGNARKSPWSLALIVTDNQSEGQS